MWTLCSVLGCLAQDNTVVLDQVIELVRAGALSVVAEAEGAELVQPGEGKVLALATT